MEVIDNKEALFFLDEVYKYKNLIDSSDRDLIKKIIFETSEEANKLHQEFIRLVTQEVDHKLNKKEFAVLKDQLIREINAYLKK
ncbi:MAG: hypothetical protein ACPGSL_07245 [Vicingaceae bacterium]